MNDRRRWSLKRRMMTIAIVIALVGGGGVVLLGTVNHRMGLALGAKTQGLFDEQHVADGIISGLMRQIVTASSVTGQASSELQARFDSAGAAVYEGLRTYLFRDLAPAERAQIERVREVHQALEVAAVRVAQLGMLGDAAAVAEARQEVMAYGTTLLSDLDDFLRMREDAVLALAGEQERLVRTLGFALPITAVVLGLLLAALLVQLLNRRVVQPLEQLALAAVRVGEGDLATRVEGEFDREFSELAASFNTMTAQLSQAQAEVVQAEKLGAVGRMTAGIAHELNNPLASVLGFSELLAQELRLGGALSADQAATYVDPIVREATRARLLIRNLLQLSHQAGTEIGPVSLRDALSVVVELRARSFRQASLGLDVATLPDVAVRAEQMQLENVLLNIVNNAFDAMRDQHRGGLQIAAHVEGARVRITLDDTGPGLREPDRVFEPFYTTKDVGEGTGLGLAVARRAIESFGGSIGCENRPGGGARFVIVLPVVAPASASATLEPPHTAVDVVPLEGRTILVVEDEPDLQRLSRRLIEPLGVEVLVAGSAAEARAVLATRRVDAVVSDVRMPGESGIELYHWIEREYPELAERFLFVTGDIRASELRAWVETRPNALLLKPFELEDYQDRIRWVLSLGVEPGPVTR